MHYSRAGHMGHGPVVYVSDEMALASVKPVMEYLDNLHNNASDRTLTREEDSTACELLLRLKVPDNPQLKFYVDHYIELMPGHASRSLLGWYFFARNLAGFIYHCEHCGEE